MLLTVVACTASQTPQAQETTQTSEKAQTSKNPPYNQARQKDPDDVYDGIIDQYTKLLTAKNNGQALSAPHTKGMDDREAAIAEALYGIVDSYDDVSVLGYYGYKDVDGNGINELLIMTKYASLKAIFTVSKNKPILLEANYGVGGNTSFHFATRNRFFMSRNTITDNIGEITFYTCHVDGDKMVYDAIYGDVYDNEKLESLEKFQMLDGNRTPIDQETFSELNQEHNQSSRPNYIIDKLLAPRIHFPLKNKGTNEDLPVADFSSYAAIRETYKAISTSIDKFSIAPWLTGGYDDLFTFPNNISFEYYNRLLYATYYGGFISCIGYDEIDINGDGQDELVLLNENYCIKAIFAQKNGTPVLLDTFASGICWVDDQGFIHADRLESYELEYCLYEFTKSGDYNFVYSILAAENGNRYLTKDGKTEKITFEHSLELYYNEYCRYSEPFEPNDHTRNVSELTYTPLFETAEDLVKAATDKTWHKYTSLEKTTGKDLAHSITTVNFENVTDTSIDVNIKYEFTFLYPDPDRDHYLLSDTTESTLNITASAKDGIFVFNESGIK